MLNDVFRYFDLFKYIILKNDFLEDFFYGIWFGDEINLEMRVRVLIIFR